MKPEDALATSMLVFFAFSFGVLLTIFITMRRNAGKEDELEELRDIIEGSPRERAKRKKAKKSTRKSPPPKKEPWEKEADWWRNDE